MLRKRLLAFGLVVLAALYPAPGFGMVRADIGVPINDPYGKTGVQLHLVIGPDL